MVEIVRVRPDHIFVEPSVADVHVLGSTICGKMKTGSEGSHSGVPP
jgi:hypothetical protein